MLGGGLLGATAAFGSWAGLAGGAGFASTLIGGIGFGSGGGTTGKTALGAGAPTSGAAAQGGMNGTGQNTGVEAPLRSEPDDPVYCGEPGAPKCAPTPAPRDITRLDRIAMDFFRRHQRIAERLNNEFATVIDVSPDGKRFARHGSIKVSNATPGGPDQVRFRMYPNTRATAHIHQGEGFHPTFSATDIEVARSTKTISYVSVNRGQYVLRFDPRTDTITSLPGVWGQLPTGGFLP
jgi:hypothetical protein